MNSTRTIGGRTGKTLLALALLASTVALAPSSAGAQTASVVVYDEAIEGDLGDDPTLPVSVEAFLGGSIINGTVIEGDIDYVQISVGRNTELSAINLLSYESDLRNASFIAVQEGFSFTEPPVGTNRANLLGYTLFGDPPIGTDILPAIGMGSGSQGFTGALPAGDYTFWIQEVDPSLSAYSLEFIVTDPDAAPAPEPEPEPEVLFCNGLEVTVNLANGDVPTEGDDVIQGTPNDDVIFSGGGNDTICALQGDDVIDGGDGFDAIYAGFGDDTVFGGAGNDMIVGSLGVDFLSGGLGNDRIRGGDGADLLAGEGGNDLIRGGNGNDAITGGNGADQLWGNLGRDTVAGGGGDDVIRGGAWLDTMDGGNGNDGCTLTDPAGLVEVRDNCERGVFGL